jgi:hypothetical protein
MLISRIRQQIFYFQKVFNFFNNIWHPFLNPGIQQSVGENQLRQAQSMPTGRRRV